MSGDILTAARAGPLSGSLEVPGDKSLSHRAVLLAAMAEGESRITGLSDGEDVRRTVQAVAALGARVERHGGALAVRGGPWRSPAAPIDCGNSGTSARLLMGAVAGRPVAATFTGDESLSRRPMARVIEPLRQMGVRIEGSDRLPVTVNGGGLRGITYLNQHGSAQVKSAILLAGLGSDAPVAVVEPLPSRDHSERMLGAFGVNVRTEQTELGLEVSLPAQRRLQGVSITVSGDPSSAAFPLVAALLTPGSRVTVTGVLTNRLRTGLFATLQQMGADLEFANLRSAGGEEVADITARDCTLRGVTVPAERSPSMIDEYPILAVAAAFAEGETVMHGLGELRFKESDRLAAILGGLTACGVEARIAGDSLHVQGGGAPGGALVPSQGDHRIAMSFLVLGLASDAPVSVDEARMIGTSFPGFVPLMHSLGAAIEPG